MLSAFLGWFAESAGEVGSANPMSKRSILAGKLMCKLTGEHEPGPGGVVGGWFAYQCKNCKLWLVPFGPDHRATKLCTLAEMEKALRVTSLNVPPYAKVRSK